LKITYDDNGVTIESAYGTISGGTLLHMQLANMLIQSSKAKKETRSSYDEPRVIEIVNVAEEEFITLKEEEEAGENFKDTFKKEQ
jgi:hypothetical protein